MTKSSQNESTPVHGTGPVGAGELVVQEGDCMTSIASDHGFFWETLWNLPENSQLRQVRKDPNVLLPGDCVYVPPLRAKFVSAATERRHRFVRRGEPAKFTIQVLRADEPVACRPYTLEIDGIVSQGETDEGGNITAVIQPDARRATVRVSSEREGWLVYELEFGCIDPITEITGLQTRLINLGFECNKTGTLDEQTKAALSWFQKKAKLPVTGEPNDETRQLLVKQHGS
jgi:hypothetical protein